MKFPYSMLLDFVETTLDSEQAGDLLTMAGFEVEGIEVVDDEPVIEVKVMSNRGDGLSMLGLAREILAKDSSAKPTPLYVRASQHFPQDSSTTVPTEASISIATEDCSRYACRIFKAVSNGESPSWLQDRLKKIGQRSISYVVDLTNYVMLELGQPLHAFDLEKIRDRQIVVRKARSGEKLTTLDGKTHELSVDQMMICDSEKPLAAAGIMGGLDSEVSSETRDILLESAHFAPLSVRRTRKQLGLNTEASYRFERSVDPEAVVGAIRRFSELLGADGTDILDLYPGKKPSTTVSVRVDRASALLGMPIKEDLAKHYFERLGMEVGGHGDPYFVVPPSWRPDIVREEDLIEELGRVHGYEKIPEQLPSGLTTVGLPSSKYQEIDRVRESVIRHGYTQAINHTLRAEHPLDLPGLRHGPRTPSSPEYALLRNSLLPGLTETLQKNGGRNLQLFELGNVFGQDSEAIGEHRALAWVSTGELVPSHRKGEPVPLATFFSLKGDVSQTLSDIGRTPEYANPAIPDFRFHPSRQAILAVGGTVIGILGQIHPAVSDALRLEVETFVAEIDVDLLLGIAPRPLTVSPISKNPAVRRDIALLIKQDVPYSSIEEVIWQAAPDSLEKVRLFDDFDGEGIPSGMHSLGIALQLRKLGENFTDQEANQVRDEIVEALVALGGSTR